MVTLGGITVCRYHSFMIDSFRCKDTERLFRGVRIPRWRAIERAATIKLQLLHAAVSLDFLRVPPGNRLEALKGNRKGQHSIRINDQWRLCFRWTARGAQDVEIVDYH
jgi:proteic killer suppression protein